MRARKNTAPAPVTTPTTTAMRESLTSPIRFGSLIIMERPIRGGRHMRGPAEGAGADSFRVEDLAHLSRQLFQSERLRDQLHVGVHDSVVNDGVAGVPRRVEHLESGQAALCFVREFPAADVGH